MPAVVLAWLAGETLIGWRTFKQQGRPPMPGQLLASSGVFAALGLLASFDQWRFLAGALAWGFDIAAFMNVAQLGILTGNTTQASEVKA